MQTFLPFPSYTASLGILDKRRLNKQNVESTQILNILLNRTTSSSWVNHPAVKMWRGYENALKLYKNIGMQLAMQKGIRYVKLQQEIIYGNVADPPIIGKEDFHVSHLANLKRKAINDAGKNGNTELFLNMTAFLGIDYFNAIDESLPYVWK